VSSEVSSLTFDSRDASDIEDELAATFSELGAYTEEVDFSSGGFKNSHHSWSEKPGISPRKGHPRLDVACSCGGIQEVWVLPIQCSGV
jgi:hypothetical protein